MFQLNTENVVPVFKAGMIVRCFMVGLRYYRQNSNDKARLMNAAVQAVSNAVFDQPTIMDVNISSWRTTLIMLASANNHENPTSWAEDVLFIASPAMYAQGENIQEAYDAWEALFATVPPTAYSQYIVWAVIGNVRLSTFYCCITDTQIPVFDEDLLPGAAYEVPNIADVNVMQDWRVAILDRRNAQIEAFKALADAPAVQIAPEVECRPESPAVVDEYDA